MNPVGFCVVLSWNPVDTISSSACGWMDGWMDGWVDGWVGGWMDG